MTTAEQWKSWIGRLGYPDTPRAERHTPPGFAVRQADNPASNPSNVGNISSDGLYLLTQERWPIGELIPLTLAIQSSPENVAPGSPENIAQGSPDHIAQASPDESGEFQIPVQARVVRHGEDGVGLTFVLPEGMDPNLWGVLLTAAVILSEPEELLFILRMLRMALFLYRLCGAAADESILLLGGELDQFRTEVSLQIALGAEEILASDPGAGSMRAHPQIVANIFKYGSWVQDDLTRQLWMGLLATSCAADRIDESNSTFVDLLVNVTHVQGLILVAGCEKALEQTPETEDQPPAPIIRSPEEMIQLTSFYDLSRIAENIAYLFNFGLIERNFDFTSYLPTESFDITPSKLGLELYRRCLGHRTHPH